MSDKNNMPNLKGHLLFYAYMLLLMLSLLVTGCSTLPNGRGWGQDAIAPINLRRITHAAQYALFDLQTLIPAAGAVIFAAGDFDHGVADWATDHTPMFGSVKAAQDASDILRMVLWTETATTILLTPSGDNRKDWIYWKAKGLGVELAALGVTNGVTQLLKTTTDRARPDDPADKRSFPSGHASGAFASATLANRNLDSIDLPRTLQRTLQIGNLALASSTAWARVEGGKHFPSDVLAGAALGHFFSAFIHDAFLGLSEKNRFHLVIFKAKEGAMAELSFAF